MLFLLIVNCIHLVHVNKSIDFLLKNQVFHKATPVCSTISFGCDTIFLCIHFSETKEMSMLLVLSSAYRAGAASAFTKNRILRIIYLGTSLGAALAFTTFRKVNVRGRKY